MQWVSELDWSTLLVGFFAFLALIALINSRRRPKNFPPGPRGVPIVGYVPFLGKNGAKDIMKLAKTKYGPVMSMQLGMEDWVVLNDFESINEAFVKQGEKFSGRPSNYIFNMVTEGYGLGVSDYGPVWKSLRKFGLMTLRGFGVGKKGMEENVIEETPYLIDYLTSQEDNVSLKLALAVSNIICRVVFGSRFNYDDKKFRRMIQILRDFQTGDNEDAKYMGIMATAPFLRHIPPFRGSMARLQKELDVRPATFREIIAEHKATLDENDVRDFIDAFLLEIKKRGSGDPSFTDQQLVSYIRDLFDAGTGTTSSTLVWMILIFANHPEYQEKIYKEIEIVVGESGTPTMKHRDEMPYTRAFIQEVTRYKTLLPLGVLHKTNAEATLNGYTIPKDTTIIPNVWGVHFDPELFPNPNEFRPERFMDKDGKFVKSNHVIPFSIGPRHCLGEQLAVMELFIFLVGIVQKLKIVQDPDHPLPSIDHDECILFSSLEAPSFKVKFEKR